MNESIILKEFSQLNLRDNFFNSLREDYEGFDNWFQKKATQKEKAYILEDMLGIQGFLYLKEENGGIDNEIQPLLPPKPIIKIGTLKINPHGTKLGERFIKIITDTMISKGLDFGYLTIYDKHEGLINLIREYGFKYWGKKNNESVYVKDFNDNDIDNVKKRFPIMNKNRQKYILGIYPEYHTKLFPDSKLVTEKTHTIEDLSPTNCIEKIYLSANQNITNLKEGDLICIYRTADKGKSAEYSSVISSICTVKETNSMTKFDTIDDFIKFCNGRTVFSNKEINYFWSSKKYPYMIIFQYNLALPKRIVRKKMIEEFIIDRDTRISLVSISDEQFDKILELGKVSKNYFRS